METSLCGILIANSANKIVSSRGTQKYQNYVEGLTKRGESERDSSSSGVSDIIPTRKRQEFHESESYLLQVTHVFLPLISIYRRSASVEDEYESVSSDDVCISFHRLTSGWILISVCEKAQAAVFRQRIACRINYLGVHYGPLLSTTNPVTLRQNLARDACFIKIVRHQSLIDARAAVIGCYSIPRLHSMLKYITDQMQIYLGNNRCLLLSQGRLLCSASTSNQPIWTRLAGEDLQCILSHSHTNPLPSDTPQFEQFWLRSSPDGVAHLTDVIRVRLGRLELVCLSASKQHALVSQLTQLIRAVAAFTANSSSSDADAIDTVIETFGKTLSEAVFRQDDSARSSFLRNPAKTSSYIQTLWSRIYSEILKAYDEEDDDGIEMEPRSRSTTLIRLLTRRSGSLFGSLSGSRDSIFSTSSTRTKTSFKSMTGNTLLPHRIDTLLEHFRKQCTQILQEICTDLKRDASDYKLHLFKTGLQRIPQHSMTVFHEEAEEWDDDDVIVSTLEPSSLRLDMQAYALTLPKQHIRLAYGPENLKQHIDTFVSRNKIDTRTTAIGNTRILTVKVLDEAVGRALGVSHVEMTAVFEHFVNPQLAATQCERLTRHLAPQLVATLKYMR